MFSITFGDYVFSQRLCEFFYTYQFLENINIEMCLLSTKDEYDFIKIPLSSRGYCINITLASFIDFKNIYKEEIFNLYLQDILYKAKINRAE